MTGVPHQAGTGRVGSDHASTVLNTDCRVHELDNLYVIDTSFFPSIGAVNRAPNPMANAVRVRDRQADAWTRGNLNPSPPMSHNGARAVRHRVVIVGGGFGGMEAARRLKEADVDVAVIDRHNHLLFQPLIYQVAAGALASGQVAAPQRHMLKRQANATVLMAAVTDIDVEHRHVALDVASASPTTACSSPAAERRPTSATASGTR